MARDEKLPTDAMHFGQVPLSEVRAAVRSARARVRGKSIVAKGLRKRAAPQRGKGRKRSTRH